MRGMLKRFGVVLAVGCAVNGAAQAADFGDEPRDAQLHMMTLRYEFGAGQQNFFANGVRLTQMPPQAPALHAQDSGGSNAGVVVLAVGVGLALIILAGGHAAHESQPAAVRGP